MWWRRGPLVVAPWLWFAVRDATPLLELVAVTLPLLAAVAVAALVALARRERWFAVPAVSVALAAAVAVVTPWLPRDLGHPADPGVRIVVANVLADNPSPEAVARDILDQDGDVVVVPEAPLAVHRLLEEAYPYAFRAERRDPVLSAFARVPVTEPRFVGGLVDGTRQHRLEVHAPGGDFVLWAVHLPRPWLTADGSHQMRPPGHARKLDAFLEAFAAEGDVPVVVAGDTNLADRGRGYRRMTARFDDALRGTWGGPTARKWYLRPLLLRVDHVFVPKEWCADGAHRFSLSGSDHRGVVVRVGPCATNR